MSKVRDTTILVECGECGKIFDIAVDFEDFLDWKEGELVQNAFPYLTANERELLLSQTCGDCCDKMCACICGFDFAENEEGV